MVKYEEFLKLCLKEGVKEADIDKVWNILLDIRLK